MVTKIEEVPKPNNQTKPTKMAAMKTNGSTRKTTLFSTIRYEHLVAGFSGGVTSTLILHPLDLIKIRFAGMIAFPPTVLHGNNNGSNFFDNSMYFLLPLFCLVNDGRTTTTPQYRGLTSAFITIFRQEGLSGLYKGVTPNVCGSGSAWGFYFLL